MTDIDELRQRLTAALDRIGARIAAIEPPTPGPIFDEKDVAALREELDAEKTANAQLEERVRALHARNTELEAAQSALRASTREAQTEVQVLRKTTQHLQASLSSVREAAETGVIEPHLINQTMMSELEGLRSLRDADRAELDALLGALDPLLEASDSAARTKPENADA